MVSRGEDKYVVWPIYFDKSVSKLAGRKVSKKQAVDKPNIEDIAKAAKSLKLNPRFAQAIILYRRKIIVSKKEFIYFLNLYDLCS